MNEMLEMSTEIDYNNLVSDFKGPTTSITLTKFGDPIYGQLKRSDKTIQQAEKEQEDFKKLEMK